MIRVRTIVLVTCAFAALTLHAATFTVTTTADSGAGSLRQAIVDANATPGADTIAFGIGSGPQLIAPLSPLPALRETATIDGTTQPGYGSSPVITIDGSNISGGNGTVAGFFVDASSTAITGLAITHFRVSNYTDGYEGAGVVVRASNCSITKCYLGLQRNGATAAGNDSGIRVEIGSATIQSNVISGNTFGVTRWNVYPWAGTHGRITIQSNIINLNAAANAALIQPYAYAAWLAGDVLVINNRVLGGIVLTADGGVVKGNKLGAFANGLGVQIAQNYDPAIVVVTANINYPTHAVIGGSNPGDGNDITSTPSYGGVYVDGVAGTQIIGNTFRYDGSGVHLIQSPGTSITGNTFRDNYEGVQIQSGAGNLISKNSFYDNHKGIVLEGGSNLGQSAPVLTSVKSLNGSTTVEGTISGNSSSTYKLEFFNNPLCDGDHLGEGKIYIGSANVTTGGSGSGSFNVSFPTSLSQGTFVTATATDSGNNTSELSVCEHVQGPGAFTLSSAFAAEGGTAAVQVLRTGGSAGSVSVDYATVDNTAHAGNDYVAKSGTLLFADGESQKTISIQTINDALYEGNEQLFVTLSNATGGTTIVNGTAGVVINDDETPPAISMDPVSLLRPATGTTPATFTIELSTASALPASVSYHTENGTAIAGTDYQPVSGAVTFAPGQTSKNVDVTVLSGNASGPDRDFSLVLSVTNATPASLSAKCTILSRNVGISPATQSVPNGGKGKMTVSFGHPLAAGATLQIKSSRPEAFSVPATLQAAPGATNASFQVTALTAPASARIEVTFPAEIGGDVLSANISSYEKATLVLQPSPVTVIAGGTLTVTASLTPASDQMQVIALEDIDATVADAPASVTIPAGGNGTFDIAGVRRGQSSVRATLPARYGSQTTMLFVDVIDAPVTPAIFSVSPATGPTAGGSAVIVPGGRLRNDCTLAFGGTPAQTNFVNETRLTAITPAHVAGTVDVALTCGQDAFLLANGFTFFTAGPAISNVAPAFGNIAGGTIVQIDGGNLSNICGVFFGGSPAHHVALDGTALIATAPQHQAGAVDVTVRCGTESATRGAAFTYMTSEEPAAAISSVDPLVGSMGQSVTLSGLRFRAGDHVVFGATPAVILSTTNDTHVVRIPDVPLGPIAITLTDPNDHVTTTGPIFTIVEPVTPKIIAVAPLNVVSGDELVIDGEGFRPGYTFAIGDRAASILSTSYSRVVIRVPPLDAGSYRVNVINSGGNIAAIGPSIAVGSSGLAVTGVSMSCSSTDGGGTATIRGSGFAAGASVMFGDAAATNVIVIDAQTITAGVPASAAAGPVRISVTNANGDGGALSNAFRYTSPFDPDGCGARRRSGSR